MGRLEAYTTLGFLAARTSRVRLFTLVTGVTYRTPGLLAKTVTTLDVLSGGRAWLGVDAAWNAMGKAGLALHFPANGERFERLEETLRICLQMWAGGESPYRGTHHQLGRPFKPAQSLSRPHPPIMIGGGGEKKPLPLVAKYAQACNLFPSPESAHKLEVLREHCDREGRDYDEIEKTAISGFDVGPKGENVGTLVDRLGGLPALGMQSVIGGVTDASTITPLETIGSDLIPAVAQL